MNGLCGSTTISTASTAIIQDRSIGGNMVGGTGSPNRRGVVGQNSTGSGSITGIGQPLIANQSTDIVRKSRSQGGKKLQKCLSTASYGEESSFSRPQMTPLSHNLLMTRQYCSFGSTTSLNHFFFWFFKFLNFQFFVFLIKFFYFKFLKNSFHLNFIKISQVFF